VRALTAPMTASAAQSEVTLISEPLPPISLVYSTARVKFTVMKIEALHMLEIKTLCIPIHTVYTIYTVYTYWLFKKKKNILCLKKEMFYVSPVKMKYDVFYTNCANVLKTALA
jgi:hypothetical protein